MDIRKLQRAIVDGLEDVKAQDIVVFNTEHLSPLFERVIIASGTSNRQTKALASSVRVAVKSSGQQVLRCEGEDNGEWIIVDCGAAVAHIMQPAIRDYYRLEEIWGGKVVKMKLGEGKGGLVKASEEDQDAPPAKKAAAKTAAKKAAPRKAATASSGAGKAALAGAKPAKKSAEKAPAAKKSSAPRKVTVGTAATAKPAAARKTAGKAPVKTTTGGKAPAKKAAIKTIVLKPPMKKTTGKKLAAAPKRGR
ncbi:MAG: ribosome silencing factor [Vitreoscilla sp.]|nr:ribosome silencing factor [Vitreoscilla sp.]